MPIAITLDRLLAARKLKAKELAATIGVSESGWNFGLGEWN